jgi:hypothetical protein
MQRFSVTASVFVCVSAAALFGRSETPPVPVADLKAADVVVTEEGQPQAVPPCQGLRWLVDSRSLQHSRGEFPLELQRKYFDSPCTFLVGDGAGLPDYRDWSSVRTRTITTLATLDRAVSDSLAAAVLYDPEVWDMTPPEEQRHPVEAACRAASAAHANHKLLIATPAINLVRFLRPGAPAGGQRFAEFEKTSVAGDMARCADVYEIQAQGVETNRDQFRAFVLAEVRQARAANPGIIVLAGISTNPMGQHVTAQQVLKAVESVREIVDGFWLNIPGGPYCPTCGVPQPKVAVELLRLLKLE